MYQGLLIANGVERTKKEDEKVSKSERGFVS